MINFQNPEMVKLHLMGPETYAKILAPIFIEDEYAIGTFKGVRDGVVFTNYRIITINIQGVTGKRKDISSLPYKFIQAFSFETAGVGDLDNQLQVWFPELGMISFEFLANVDISEICRIISTYSLS